MSKKHQPHGQCERTDNHDGRCIGPAAFVVTRDGKELRLCTRCDLTTDKPTCRLLVDESDPLGPFAEWDSIGAFCIVGLLAEAREAKR